MTYTVDVMQGDLSELNNDGIVATNQLPYIQMPLNQLALAAYLDYLQNC